MNDVLNQETVVTPGSTNECHRDVDLPSAQESRRGDSLLKEEAMRACINFNQPTLCVL